MGIFEEDKIIVFNHTSNKLLFCELIYFSLFVGEALVPLSDKIPTMNSCYDKNEAFCYRFKGTNTIFAILIFREENQKLEIEQKAIFLRTVCCNLKAGTVAIPRPPRSALP